MISDHVNVCHAVVLISVDMWCRHQGHRRCVYRQQEGFGGEVGPGETCSRCWQDQGHTVTTGAVCWTTAAQHCTQVSFHWLASSLCLITNYRWSYSTGVHDHCNSVRPECTSLPMEIINKCKLSPVLFVAGYKSVVSLRVTWCHLQQWSCEVTVDELLVLWQWKPAVSQGADDVGAGGSRCWFPETRSGQEADGRWELPQLCCESTEHGAREETFWREPTSWWRGKHLTDVANSDTTPHSSEPVVVMLLLIWYLSCGAYTTPQQYELCWTQSTSRQLQEQFLCVCVSVCMYAVCYKGCVPWYGDNGQSVDRWSWTHLSESRSWWNGVNHDDSWDNAHTLLGEGRK